jgi:hypothetical protein
VSQHNRSGASPIEVGANSPAICDRNRDGLLSRRWRGHREHQEHGSQQIHPEMIQLRSVSARFQTTPAHH